MALRSEVLELKKGQPAPQHQLQPPPHRLRSRHVVCFTRTMYLNWRRPARAMPQNWRIARPSSRRCKGPCEHSTKHTRHSTRRGKSRCEHSTKHTRHFQTSTRQRLPAELTSRSNCRHSTKHTRLHFQTSTWHRLLAEQTTRSSSRHSTKHSFLSSTASWACNTGRQRLPSEQPSRVEGQPWVPDGSTVGPRFLGGNRGFPHKNRQIGRASCRERV